MKFSTPFATLCLWAGLANTASSGPALAQDSFAEASRAARAASSRRSSRRRRCRGKCRKRHRNRLGQHADRCLRPTARLRPAASGAGPNLDALMQLERQDYGVPPTSAAARG